MFIIYTFAKRARSFVFKVNDQSTGNVYALDMVALVVITKIIYQYWSNIPQSNLIRFFRTQSTYFFYYFISVHRHQKGKKSYP